MDWNKAEDYLNFLIQEYESVGWAGPTCFALSLTLIPLKNRLDKGERTESLYNEIMELCIANSQGNLF